MDARAEWIKELTPNQRKLLGVPAGRLALSRASLKNFCMIYFADIMKSSSTNNVVTMSEFHTEFMKDSIRFTRGDPGPAQSRVMWVCPRGSGKSTLVRMQLIWLAAFGHQKFVTIFSSTVTQAEDMLSNIRSIFDQNQLLRQDFPDLIRPAKRREAATMMANNKQLLMQDNGFVLAARGIETSVLGMNIGNMRPSMIILDDIEASEANTTKNDVEATLDRLQSDIYPLNENAHVVWIGTTTRPGGLVEAGVHSVLDMPHPEWVETDNFSVHYHPALTVRDNGSQESMWPERWSTEWLLSQQHTRSFKKNYACLPSSEDSPMWSTEDFVYEAAPEDLTGVILSIDPAVTTKKTSDETGLAVVGWSPSQKKVYVLHSEGVRLGPVDLRHKVLGILEEFQQVVRIVLETNQGGEYLSQALHDMPVGIDTVHQSRKKELRAEEVFVYYQRDRIRHVRPLARLETQMMQFPGGKNDDMVDAVTSAVLYLFAKLAKQGRTGSRVESYI